MNKLKVLFTIFNYKESTNAEHLYKMIFPYFPCHILDSDSGERPQSFDGDTIYLPNVYYGGLLHKAIELAQLGEYTFLFIICSDVLIEESQIQHLIKILQEEDFSDTAIYSPSHTEHSYTFVQWGYNQKTNTKRGVPFVEGMISMLHKDIFNRLYPCKDNKWGWGFDICASYYAKELKQKMYIDDRVQIYHPMGNTGKNDAAGISALQYIDQLSGSNQIRDYWHWIYVYRLNKSANILLLKHYKFWCRLFYKLRKFFLCFGYKF